MRQRREDRRAGEVAVAIYNVYRDTKKRPDPWDWMDIFPEHRELEEPQTEEQMLMNMNLLAGHIDEDQVADGAG